MLGKILLMLAAAGAAYGFITYSRVLVKIFGHNSWAERQLGPGGSELLWKGIGLILFFLGLLNLTGQLDFLQ
jgi:hypothetical protein